MSQSMLLNLNKVLSKGLDIHEMINIYKGNYKAPLSPLSSLSCAQVSDF